MSNRQATLPGSGFERYAKTMRREQLLADMNRAVPCAELCALIEHLLREIALAASAKKTQKLSIKPEPNRGDPQQ